MDKHVISTFKQLGLITSSRESQSNVKEANQTEEKENVESIQIPAKAAIKPSNIGKPPTQIKSTTARPNGIATKTSRELKTKATTKAAATAVKKKL